MASQCGRAQGEGGLPGRGGGGLPDGSRSELTSTPLTSATGGDGFASTYGVELLYKARPGLRTSRVVDCLKARCPEVTPLEADAGSGTLVFAHTDHLSHYGAGAVPAECIVTLPAEAIDSEALSEAIQQTWRWLRGRKVAGRCRTSVGVSDYNAAALAWGERLELFQRCLAAVVEAIPCVAIHWRPTQQVVDPAEFTAAMVEQGYRSLAPGALNVRTFRVRAGSGEAGGAEEMLLDTLGLAALGLPDLQCHFRGLGRDEVAQVLRKVAGYIFKQGPVVGTGDTVPGARPGEAWACRLEQAVVPPNRPVIDLRPGEPYAAGDRPQ